MIEPNSELPIADMPEEPDEQPTRVEGEKHEKDYYDSLYKVCLLVGQSALFLVDKVKSLNLEAKTEPLDVRLEYLDQLEDITSLSNTLREAKELVGTTSEEKLKGVLAETERLVNQVDASAQRKKKDYIKGLTFDALSTEEVRKRIDQFLHDTKKIENLRNVYEDYEKMPDQVVDGQEGFSKGNIASYRKQYQAILDLEKSSQLFVGATAEKVKEKKEKIRTELLKVEDRIIGNSGFTRESLREALDELGHVIEGLIKRAELEHSSSSVSEIVATLQEIVDSSKGSLNVQLHLPEDTQSYDGLVPVDSDWLWRVIKRNLVDNVDKAYRVRPERKQLGLVITVFFEASNMGIRVTDFGPGFNTKISEPKNETGSVLYEEIDLKAIDSGWKSVDGKAVAPTENKGLSGVKHELESIEGCYFQVFNRIGADSTKEGADVLITLPVISQSSSTS